MNKLEKISHVAFVGIAAWFPITFLFLLLAERNILDTAAMEIVGGIAAGIMLLFIAVLWICGVARLIKGWSLRSDSRNLIYILLLFFGTIIGSMIFHILETNAFKNKEKSAFSCNLTHKGSKFVRYISWGSILFFPLGLLTGISANLDGELFSRISFFTAILTVVPYLCLFAIWFIGIFRLIIDWKYRVVTMNLGYLLLLFLVPLIGGMIFCLIDDEKPSA